MKHFLVGLAILLTIAIGSVIAVITALDANKYRDAIAETLSAKTGRQITLNGKLETELSFSGVKLGLAGVVVGNPPWAGSPAMAKISHLDMDVDVRELFHDRVAITGLAIQDADITLEADSGGRDNWHMAPLNPQTSATATDGTNAAKRTDKVSIHTDKLVITDSRVTFYNRQGQAETIAIAALIFDNHKGAELHLAATYKNVPVTLDLQAGLEDIMEPHGKWPFAAGGTYASYAVTAEGDIDLGAQKTNISHFGITAGNSTLEGKGDADWSSQRPLLRGMLVSENLAVEDFRQAAPAPDMSVTDPAPVISGQVFSNKRLNFDFLKSFDGSLAVKIAALQLSSTTLQNLDAVVSLDGGFLSIDPIVATMGEGKLDGKIKVNANTTPFQAGAQVAASGISLDDVLHMIGAPSFISGNADINFNVAGAGNTMHEMASKSLGIINFTAGRGKVSSGLTGDISSTLVSMFAPAGSNELHCLAARFVVRNGVAEDNGVLVDTGAATIVAHGGVDFGREQIDMMLQARAKSSSITGQILPAAYVTGSLVAPHFSVNPAEVIQNVKNYLFNGAGNGVPQIGAAPDGQNACVYALQNPAARSQDVLVNSNLLGQATSAFQNLTGGVRSLLGH